MHHRHPGNTGLGTAVLRVGSQVAEFVELVFHGAIECQARPGTGASEKRKAEIGRIAVGTGIRINILSPGPTNTASLRKGFGEHAEEGMAFLTAKSPLGRIGEPEEIASVAAFLASDAASYVNGAELFADGGASQT